MRKVRNQKGFTIMELMIVIVIIGILIAIAVPAYNNFVDRAQLRACQANLRTLASADGMFFAETGDHADALASLTLYLDNATTMRCPTSPATQTYSITDGVPDCSVDGH